MAGSEVTLSFVAKLVAREETAKEVAAFLVSAAELANQEERTVAWFAVRSDSTTFWIFDAFADEEARQAHITGPIAEALMANAERLLAEPPQILPADILASKLPA
jgi:quinol monooxygenase YgiN